VNLITNADGIIFPGGTDMRTIPLRKIALCLPGVLLMTAALATKPTNVDDFRAFYRAAGLVANAAGAYSNPGATPTTFLPFLRVPSYAWMLRPLHSLGYTGAHALWTAILVLAFGALLCITRERRNDLALAICCSFPAAFSLVLGQDIALVLLIAMAAARLHAANREFTAGLVASLLFIKVTFLFPVALVFLSRSRRGFYGLTTGTAIQLALCFALAGSRWPLEYLAVLRNPLLDLEPRRMLSVRALFAAAPHAGLLFGVAAALVIGWLWFASRRLRFDDAVKVALPLGLLASAHGYVYDAVVLVPLFVCVASLRTWTGRLALFGLTPAPCILLLGNTPAGVFIGSASIIAAVLLATIELYRMQGAAAQRWLLNHGAHDCPTLISPFCRPRRLERCWTDTRNWRMS
jgi:hypothetical protein